MNTLLHLGRRTRILVAVVVWLVAGSGCAWRNAAVGDAPRAAPVVSHPVQALKPVVEALYLKIRELEVVYHALRTLAHEEAFGTNDRELNHVQKSALYVQHTYENAHHQWQLFSVLAYIRPSSMTDYLTLRQQSLQQATQELAYDLRFLEIYGAFMGGEEVRRSVQQAMALAREIEGLYKKLRGLIEPLIYQRVPTAA